MIKKQICKQISFFASITTLLGSLTLLNTNEVLGGDIERAAQSHREERIKSGLKSIIQRDFEIVDDNLVITGTQEELNDVLNRLNDFDKLRKEIIPISSERAKTKGYQSNKFKSWKDCLDCLGVGQEKFSNFAIGNQVDENTSLRIDYNSDFNRSIADLYVQELKKLSPFFALASTRNPHLITKTQEHLIINYDFFNGFFCSENPLYTQTLTQDQYELKLPITNILKKIIAASSGDLSLVKGSAQDQYHIRAIMLGESDNALSLSRNLAIEIIIDNSGSMEGNKIQAINKEMPRFLGQISYWECKKRSISVKVLKFNTDISTHAEYNFTSPNQKMIQWREISTTGDTDLTKIHDRLAASTQSEHKVVVAFTDGMHNHGPDLNESLKSLEELRKTGNFAQPYLCSVGEGNKVDLTYFKRISEIFAGAFDHHQNIHQFCNKLADDIPNLLESNIPLVITIDGQDVTVRLQDSKPDIHITSQTVREGDALTYQGARAIVSTPASSKQKDDEIPGASTEKEEKLSEKDLLESQIKELQKRLAALNNS